MGATILESLSNSKLGAIIAILFGIQFVSFYIGAFLTPSPSSFEQFTSVHCYRHDRNSMAIPRHHKRHEIDIGKNCERSSAFSFDNDSNRTKTFETRTFAVQLPLPRDGLDLAYSRWMQTLLVLLIPEFQYEPLLASSFFGSANNHGQHKHHPANDNRFMIDHISLLIDVDLAVKNKEDKDWTLYARRRGLRRTLKFHAHDLRQNHKLDCDPIQLFELQSLYYDYYLINFELHDVKNNIQFPGKLSEVTGVAIHHNGGFTQIWMVLKSCFFVITSATLAWYSRRIWRLNRSTILIERLLIGVGAALTQLNFPVELFSVHFEVPFMMFLNDLRQGIFYCVLLSFWIIFVGEHLLDGTRKNSSLTSYAKELLALGIASLALLVFDLSERGLQTFDPFMTIWESEPGLARFSITVASCACLSYIGFLLYYIYLAFNTISGKQCALPKMQITKRLKYQGMIYRFKFLLCATTICAISTLVFYGLSHRNDWNYDDDSTYTLPTIEWTSAMLTTVCAMWNSYVVILMIMYAPSYKGTSGGVLMTEQIEFECLTDDRDDELPASEGDMNLLQELANKTSLD